MADTTVFGLDAILPAAAGFTFKPQFREERPVDVSPIFNAQRLGILREQLNLRRDQLEIDKELQNRKLDLLEQDQAFKKRVFEELELRKQSFQERKFDEFDKPSLDLKFQALEAEVAAQRSIDDYRKFQREQYFIEQTQEIFKDPLLGPFSGIGNAEISSNIRREHKLDDESIQELMKEGTGPEDSQRIYNTLSRRFLSMSSDPKMLDLLQNEAQQQEFQKFIQNTPLNSDGQEAVLTAIETLRDPKSNQKDKNSALNILSPSFLNTDRYLDNSRFGTEVEEIREAERLLEEGEISREEFKRKIDAFIDPNKYNRRYQGAGTSNDLSPVADLISKNIISSKGNFTDQFKKSFQGNPDNIFRIAGQNISQASLNDILNDDDSLTAVPDIVGLDGTIHSKLQVKDKDAAKKLTKEFGIQFRENTATGKFESQSFPVDLVGGTQFADAPPEGSEILSAKDTRPVMNTEVVTASMPSVKVSKDPNTGNISFSGSSGNEFVSDQTLMISEAFYNMESDHKLRAKGEAHLSTNTASSATGQYQYLWGLHNKRIKDFLDLEPVVSTFTESTRKHALEKADQLIPEGSKIRNQIDRLTKGKDEKVKEDEIIMAVTFLENPTLQRKFFEFDLFTELIPDLPKLRKSDWRGEHSDIELLWMRHHEGSVEAVSDYFNTGKSTTDTTAFKKSINKLRRFLSSSGVPEGFNISTEFNPSRQSHSNIIVPTKGGRAVPLGSLETGAKYTKAELTSILKDVDHSLYK